MNTTDKTYKSPTAGTTGVTGNDTGQELKDDARRAAQDAAETAKSTARDMADTVTSEATNYAKQAQHTAADEVKDVASALRTAADEMRDGSPQERTLSQIAQGLADASEAVRGKDLSEIVSDLNGFARRNPIAFLGGAALVGFAATRFAKASTSPRDTGSAYGGTGATGTSVHEDDYSMDRPVAAPRSTSVASTPQTGAQTGTRTTGAPGAATGSTVGGTTSTTSPATKSTGGKV